MIHKLAIVTIISALSFNAFAEDVPAPAPDTDAPRPEHPTKHHMRNDFMKNLTEEQKTCIKEYGCKMPERPEKPKGEKPDFPKGEKPAMPEGTEKPDFQKGERPEHRNRPEMTAEQKENMECMKKAMESCGIQMPEKPNHKPDAKPEQ